MIRKQFMIPQSVDGHALCSVISNNFADICFVPHHSFCLFILISFVASAALRSSILASFSLVLSPGSILLDACIVRLRFWVSRNVALPVSFVIIFFAFGCC